MQGDVVAVYSDTGIKLISYVYDAWGNTTVSYSNGGQSTTATKNPFTYRGYYYDGDYGFYCLGTRFYDPVTRRFINADTSAVITVTPTALTDKNLFAYCDNNPVMRVDNGGEFWHVVAGTIAGALVSGAACVASDLLSGEKIDWRMVGVGAAAGALSGMLGSTSLGRLTQIAGNALISGAENAISQGLDFGFENIVYGEVALSAVVNGALSFNEGITKGNERHLMTQGIKATEQLGKKGLKQSAKYYFSQTKEIFYKPLTRNSRVSFANKTIYETVNCYATRILER